MVDVTIAHPGTGPSDERALVDTGSAITVIPERLIEKLGLSRKYLAIIVGVCEVEAKFKHVVYITIGGKTFKSTQVISAGGDVLIGRRLISRWKVTLDGRNEVPGIGP